MASETETVRIEGLEGVLKTLQELPPELVSARGGPVRTALRKAAQVLVQEARANVDKIVAAPNKGDIPTESIGHLRDNIVTVRDGSIASEGVKGERYKVQIRRKKHPEYRGRGPITARGVGRHLEAGTEFRDPMPFMRQAFDAKKHEVLQIFTAELNKSLDRIVKKLARKNKAE